MMNNIQDAGTMHKCANEPCECLVPSTEEYCSAYCSEADDIDGTDLICGCGHSNCALNERLDYPQLVTTEKALREPARQPNRSARLPQDNSRSFAN
jgi:hypothetical protein